MADNWITQARSETLRKRLIADLQANIFTDVTFRVGSNRNRRTFHAHRLVLDSENSEFEKLFNESKPGTIEIPDVHPKAFENLVRYFYDRSFLFKDLESTCETYRAANKFKVEGIQSTVEETLVALAESESPSKILAICDELNLTRAAKRCREMISFGDGKVLKTSRAEMSSEATEEISPSDPGNETLLEGERVVKDEVLQSELIDKKAIVLDRTETSKLEGEDMNDSDYDSDLDDSVMGEGVLKDMIEDASKLINNCVDGTSKDTIKAISYFAEQMAKHAAEKFQRTFDDMMDYFRFVPCK